MKSKILAVAVSLGLGASVYATCPVGTSDYGTQLEGKETCVLKGRYVNDVELDPSRTWVLDGGVFIGNDNKQNSVLTIKAGSKLVGKSGADFLVITRGSKIMALGTKESPIVMTSVGSLSGETSRGQWGGLILNGNAPINCAKNDLVSFCQAEGEGSTGVYGGVDANDNSGVLNYLRVEFAGYEITPENELNGIAFQGVGAGTFVDYIQVHKNSDDGVEFFGGTVNVRHVVLTGNKDDSLDWTSGWRGKAQYVLIKQFDDQANNGIEADNFSKVQDASPRSNPYLANMTLIGTSSEKAKGGNGILLRVGTGARIFNTLVTGFKKECLNVDDAETFNMLSAGAEADDSIVMNGVVLSCNKSVQVSSEDPFNLQEWFVQENYIENRTVVNGVFAVEDLHDFAVELEDSFFDQVEYVGAFENADDQWHLSWTNMSL